MYGLTVLMTTRADSATRRIDSSSVTSAINSGTSTPRRSRTASSLARWRPARAQRVAPAWPARYSAVRPPVKPVAPSSTTSCSRSVVDVDLLGQLDGEVEVEAGAGGQPGRDRGGDPL